jgi:hypothetical protein
MDSVQLRSRLLKLLQKSRKAVRLYSSVDTTLVGKYLVSGDGQISETKVRELQSDEWKRVTTELMRDLSSALENPNPKRLVHDLYALRDRSYSDWRLAEAELHRHQKDLVTAAETSDFIKASVLSIKLIRMKAHFQASQAVYQEMQEVLSKSSAVSPAQVVMLSEDMKDQEVLLKEGNHQEEFQPRIANVIPLRQKRVLGA